MLKPQGYIIHYGELALKGKNRGEFINRLLRNIELKTKGRVRTYPGRLYLEGGNPEKLGRIPGVSWYAPCVKADRSIEGIIDRVFELLDSIDIKEKTFGLFVKRGDKSFKPNSQELSRILGKKIVDRYGMKVNLNTPDISLFITVSRDVFIHLEKIRGLGGLPVGVTGRVLSLLSGGIDSPSASYLMIKRGCEVDFLHFHAFSTNQEAMETKIPRLVSRLVGYQNRCVLYLVPYKLFQMEVFKRDIPKGYEMILFRAFMLRFAEKLSDKCGYKALVIGDSLSQVASQTLENISSVYRTVSLPILHPLIGFDKEDIVSVSRHINTYELSIEPYKECCSILSKNPKTRTDPFRIEGFLDRLGIDEIVERSLAIMDKVEFDS